MFWQPELVTIVLLFVDSEEQANLRAVKSADDTKQHYRFTAREFNVYYFRTVIAEAFW